MIFGIPQKLLESLYNSSDNIVTSVDDISSTGITLNVKDTNKYTNDYDYNNNYYILKKENEDYTKLNMKKPSKQTVSSTIIDNRTKQNTYNWESVYGILENGEYQFKTSTSNGRINISISFTINENGKILYEAPITIYI